MSATDAVALDLATAARITAALEPPLKATSFRRFESASTDVFEIAGEDRAVILKVYADAPAWKLGKEVFVAARYAALAPAPEWLRIDETRTLLSRRYALISRLPGASLRERFGRDGSEALFREMGALLKRLHEVVMPTFGYLLDGDVAKAFASNSDWMAASFETKYRDFRAWGGDADLGRRVEAFVDDRFAALEECEQPVLCHNDFHPGNVLADRDGEGLWRLSGLVDFENAVAGDPLFDLVKALDYTAHECAAGRDPLAAGYGALDRPGAEDALLLYRIFHKLELLNWFVMARADPLGPPHAALLADLDALTAQP